MNPIDAFWQQVERDFRAWLEAQPEDVQELGLLKQIDLYAASSS